MLRTAVTKKGWAVAKYVMEDLCLYLGTPLAFHYHLTLRPKRRYFTMWTLENMKRQIRPRTKPTGYVDSYLRVSRVLLIFVLVGVCAVLIGRLWDRRGVPPSVSALLIVLSFHCMNSFFFGFLTSRFHVRYALPSYRLVLLTCYILLVAYVSEKRGPLRDQT